MKQWACQQNDVKTLETSASARQLVNVSCLKDFPGGSHFTTKHLLLEPQRVKIQPGFSQLGM